MRRNPVGVARAFACLLAAGVLAACPAPGGGPDGGTDGGGGPEPPSFYCPGSPGCETADGPFVAGAAAVAITPTGFEVPRLEYLDREGDRCDVGTRCGELVPKAFDDCGTDGLCPEDPDYPGPDADGTENDGVYDFFEDCGRDRICPGDPEYTGPDADGTEGNGLFDGLWLAGFGNNRPAVGVHDDIWARAVVLGRGDTQVALAYVDLVGFFYDDVLRVRRRIAEKSPQTADRLDYVFIGSTHTHEAPDALGQWGMALPPNGLPAVGLPEPYRSGVNALFWDETLDRIADAIIEAAQAARPARARLATGRTGVDGLVRDTRDPRIIDDTMSILELTDAETDEVIATLLNWGNHPEVLSDINNLITSDFVHYVRKGIEEGLPAEGDAPAVPGRGGIAIYLQGPVGGLLTPLGSIGARTRDGIPRDDKRDYEKARAVGERLAEKALALLAEAEEVADPELSFSSEPLLLPMENVFFQVVFGLGVFDRAAYEADGSPWNGEPIVPEEHFPYVRSEVFAMRLGPARFLSVPGELFSELAVGFDETWTPPGVDRIDPNNPNPPDLSKAPDDPYRPRMGGRYTFVLGLGNDEIGYLVPPYDFVLDEQSPYYEEAAGDHYEETNSLGPQTVPVMEEALFRLMDWERHPNGR